MLNRGLLNVNYEWDFLPQTKSPFQKIEEEEVEMNEEEEEMEEELKQTEEYPKGYGEEGAQWEETEEEVNTRSGT